MTVFRAVNERSVPYLWPGGDAVYGAPLEFTAGRVGRKRRVFMAQDSLPLARFKVLDLTRVRSGPTAVKVFADWAHRSFGLPEYPGN